MSTLRTVQGLEDDFAEAMTKLYAVGNDLARLRSSLAAQERAATSAPAPAAATHTGSTSPTTPTTAPALPPAPRHPAGQVTPPPVLCPQTPALPPPPARPVAPQRPWWSGGGVTAVLAVAGPAITLVGVAFLVAIAVQLGYFGPAARVVSGGVLAVGLVAAGVLVARRQSTTTGAVGLVATGLAAAFMDVVAVTRIYDWVPAPVGLVVAGVITGGGLVLARRWERELLGVLTVLGAACLVPTVGYPDATLVGAFLVLLTAATWPTQIGHRWHVLETVRVVPTALWVGGLALAAPTGDHRATVLALLLMGTVLLTSLLGLRHRALSPHLGVLAALATIPALLAGSLESPWVGTLVLVGVVAAHAAVAALAPHVDAPHLRLVEVCVVTAGVASFAVALQVGDRLDASAVVLGVVALAWLGAALLVRHDAVGVTAAGLGGIAAATSVVLLPAVVDRGLAGGVTAQTLLHAMLVVATLALALPLARRLEPRDVALAAVAVLAALVVLAAGMVVVLAGALLGDRLDAAATGFTVGQAATTVMWLAVAVGLLVVGGRRDVGAMITGALALAALCVGKLVLFDLAFLDGLARVGGFILGGLLLLGMAVLFAQVAERGGRPRPPVDNSGPVSSVRPSV